MATWLIDSAQLLTLEEPVDQLDVWLARGTLRVVATDGPPRIDVRKVGQKGIAVTLERGVLAIRHDMDSHSWWRWMGPIWWFGAGWRRFNAHVTVAVPPAVAARLTVISGSVVASGLRTGATIDVTSGSVALTGLAGTVRAKTMSGSIEALGIGGDLALETVSGEISVAESYAERIQLRTISGALTCDLGNPFAHDVRLDTTSGEITVRVPANADLRVSLNATSGRVTTAFPQVRTMNRPGLHSADGRLGAGTGILNAYAVSGSVSLLAAPAVDRSDGRDGRDGSDGSDASDVEGAE